MKTMLKVRVRMFEINDKKCLHGGDSFARCPSLIGCCPFSRLCKYRRLLLDVSFDFLRHQIAVAVARPTTQLYVDSRRRLHICRSI